jgi:hypothetical protein
MWLTPWTPARSASRWQVTSAPEWTQVVSFQSPARNTAGDIRLWVWYWIDSEQVRRWRRQRGAACDSRRVFGCALGYLGDPAAFIGWNIAGDLVPVVREVVDRVR